MIKSTFQHDIWIKRSPSHLWSCSTTKMYIYFVLFPKIEKNMFFFAVFWRFLQVWYPPRSFRRHYIWLVPTLILFHTYNMVLWPLETFLRALEVGCMWFWEAQKELKIMEFELLRESVGKTWVWGRPKLQLEWNCSRIYVRGYEPR